MSHSELGKNIRKAYRLLYLVQNSLVDFVDYCKDKIDYKYARGKQLFSSAIEKYKTPIGDRSDKFGDGMWAWDYFPTYMYEYYFSLRNIEEKSACFAIIQVMDDGSFHLKYNNAPNPVAFKDEEESRSYLLFAFSIWDDNNKQLWFDNYKEEIDGELSGIIQIIETIDKSNKNTFSWPTEENPSFVIMRVEFDKIEEETKVNSVLESFKRLIEDNCRYNYFLKKE